MKKLLIIFLCIVMGFAIGFYFNNDVESDVLISGSPKENVEQAKNSASKLSKLFVKSLLIKDFDTALETMQLEEDIPIWPEDIEFIYPNTSFSNLLDFTSSEYTIEADVGFIDDSKTKAISVITVKDKNSDNFEMVKVNVIKKGKVWAVEENEFYFQNVHFTTPGGSTEVLINDKKLSDGFYTSVGSNETNVRTYFLPKTGYKPFTVTVRSENFNFQKTIEPLKYNHKEDDVLILPPVLNEDEVLQSLKKVWNGMSKEYIENRTDSTFSDYINSSVVNYSIEDLQRCFDVLYRKENGSHSKLKKEDFSIADIKNNNMYWATNDDIYIDFGYKLSWLYVIDNQYYSMKRNSEIFLEYKNEKYKISGIPDLELFLMSSWQIKEW